MEFLLYHFYIVNWLFFDSDFNEANSSLVKFKGALFLLFELNDESSLF